MTKTSKATGQTNTRTAAEEARETKDEIGDKLPPEAAREFVTEQAETARARAEAVSESAAEVNAEAGRAAQSLVGLLAGFNRDLIDMTADNLGHALTTAEKLAAAKSLPEAIGIQTDFIRDRALANAERMKRTTDAARETMTQSTGAMRDAAGKAMKAAAGKAA